MSKTIAQRTAVGPVYSFTTASDGPPPPPPGGGSEIVLYAADARNLTGAWVLESDATAAGGKRIRHPNAGAAKLTAPLATPVHSFELTFTAETNRAYRLWIRGKADSNSYANDSVFVQFSGSTTSSGASTSRIGTAAATDFNAADADSPGGAGKTNGWGNGVLGPLIYFASSGPQTMRLQTREDGLAIDQVVLSPTSGTRTIRIQPREDGLTIDQIVL